MDAKGKKSGVTRIPAPEANNRPWGAVKEKQLECQREAAGVSKKIVRLAAPAGKGGGERERPDQKRDLGQRQLKRGWSWSNDNAWRSSENNVRLWLSHAAVHA